MRKLNMQLVIKQSKQRTQETIDKYIQSLTHLNCQERSIDEVDDLSALSNLTVVYLYGNCLRSIPNFAFAQNLTHLYLQNNEITSIENLASLKKLSKLYLGGNCIGVLEGLEYSESLRELHIENQRLPPGEKLLFDPTSLNALSLILEVLNVAGNSMTTVRDLSVLEGLTNLIITDNLLRDLADLETLLVSCSNIKSLSVDRNPLCKQHKYRDKIILMTDSLVSLDGKEVTPTMRAFLQNWHAKKSKRRASYPVITDTSKSLEKYHFSSMAITKDRPRNQLKEQVHRQREAEWGKQKDGLSTELGRMKFEELEQYTQNTKSRNDVAKHVQISESQSAPLEQVTHPLSVVKRPTSNEILLPHRFSRDRSLRLQAFNQPALSTKSLRSVAIPRRAAKH